jgi:hypothetical protein
MKKIILLIALVMLYATSASAVTSAASAALTWGGSNVYGNTVAGTQSQVIVGKTSTNVGLGWSTSTGGYALETQHASGTKAFGTAADATSIYQTPVTTVGTAVGPTSWTTGSSSFGSGWTTM